MPKKRAKGSGSVLPKADSRAGNKSIRSVDQMLTPSQRQKVRSDLSEMARRRREAEASSSSLRLS